jgi:hypothetical protein
MTEYIPRKDLEDLDAAAIEQRLRYEEYEGVRTISRCTTTGCGKPARSGVCADCLTHELEARKA